MMGDFVDGWEVAVAMSMSSLNAISQESGSDFQYFILCKIRAEYHIWSTEKTQTISGSDTHS